VADGCEVIIIVEAVVVVWKDCIKNPDTIGPMDIPTIIITTLIPRDMPLYCIGVEVIIILNIPVFSNANPTAITARFPSTSVSVEWNANILENPTSDIIVPNTTGFMLPIFEMMNPEAGANIKNIIIKGNCTIAASTALPPKPPGGGLRTRKGIV